MKRRPGLTVLLLFVLSACAPVVSSPTAPATLTETRLPTATLLSTSTATSPPTFSTTSDPYLPYAIEYLQSRSYGGGQIEFLEILGQNILFTRYLIRYPSDGLNIYGFANIPNDEGPHPVIIALHGYIDPGIYNTLDYTTHYADALASAGYIVLHPNLRGYSPSDDGENLFRVGMATDVLNLISLIQSQSEGSGPLPTADPNLIGLWGHSMGGGISTRVLTVNDDIRAAVLYGAMSGDEQKITKRYSAGQGTRVEWRNWPFQWKRWPAFPRCTSLMTSLPRSASIMERQTRLFHLTGPCLRANSLNRSARMWNVVTTRICRIPFTVRVIRNSSKIRSSSSTNI